jgi:hypothetical protein
VELIIVNISLFKTLFLLFVKLLSRLGQVFFTDMVSRAIDFRLDWIRKNERTIFGGRTR